MKFEKRHIDSLTIDPANLRLHNQRNLNAIKSSLARFGLQKPVVITPDGIIVAGNGTVEAAKELGWTEINVVVTELDHQAQIEYSLADNRSQELSDWNYEGLSETFRKMIEGGEWTLDDARELGWESHELEPLLNAEWSIEELEEEDLDEEEDDAHPGRTEFRNLVRRVTDKVRTELAAPELEERDALKYCYLTFLGESVEDYK